MNNPKILFLLDSVGIGGAEKVILSLYREHIRKDKKGLLVSLYIDNNFKSDKLTPIVLGNSISSIFRLYRAVIDFEPNVIFVCLRKSTFLASIFNFFFRLISKRKIYYILRESSIPSKQLELTKKNKWLYKGFIKNVYPIFDKIIVQSQDMAEDLKNNFNIKKEKIVLINNPIDCKFKLQSIPPPKGKPIFITVGNLRPEKGHDRIIESLALLPKNLDFEYWILGEGIKKADIIERIKVNNLEGKVKLLGQISPVLIPQYLSQATLFLQGSYSEGFPNSLLEASLYKVPIIAFNVLGGTKEIILEGFNGFLVPDYNLVKFKDTILIALAYSFKLDEFPKYIEDKFGSEKILYQYEQLFVECVES